MKSRKVALAQPLITNLCENVVTALHQKGYPPHRLLKIKCDPGASEGTVIVEGFLPTYHLRQVALECIRRVPGVSEVVDQIQVVRESPDVNEASRSEVVPASDTDTQETEVCSATGMSSLSGS